MIVEYIFKQLWKHKVKPREKRKYVPIVRTTMQDGNIFQDIVGATKPGSKKMQFPYELPVIETAVDITPGVKNALYGVTGLFTAGLITAAVIKRSKPS